MKLFRQKKKAGYELTAYEKQTSQRACLLTSKGNLTTTGI